MVCIECGCRKGGCNERGCRKGGCGGLSGIKGVE